MTVKNIPNFLAAFFILIFLFSKILLTGNQDDTLKELNRKATLLTYLLYTLFLRYQYILFRRGEILKKESVYVCWVETAWTRPEKSPLAEVEKKSKPRTLAGRA
jgi:hypothetical protein